MSKLSIKITPKFKCIAEIPGYEDCIDYDIYMDGRVYSRKSNRFMKGNLNNGYLQVTFNEHREYMHRLVALAFIDNPDNKTCVDHTNGIRDDNRVDNLRWSGCDGNAQNRKMVISNTTGQQCIVRSHIKRVNHTNHYYEVYLRVNGKRYRKVYRIGNLPLDANNDDVDSLYKANPITAEMIKYRDYLKELHHGQFSSTLRNKP